MKTKEETLKEKLEKIIFDWIPCDNNRMKRQPDKNKISLILDLFSQQKQEIVEEIEKELREWAIFYSGIEIDNIHLKHARDVIIADLLNEITELKQKLTK